MKITAKFIIGLWPSCAALARDMGVSCTAPMYWAKKNRIPLKYHAAMMESAKNRRIKVAKSELEAVK